MYWMAVAIEHDDTQGFPFNRSALGSRDDISHASVLIRYFLRISSREDVQYAHGSDDSNKMVIYVLFRVMIELCLRTVRCCSLLCLSWGMLRRRTVASRARRARATRIFLPTSLCAFTSPAHPSCLLPPPLRFLLPYSPKYPLLPPSSSHTPQCA